MLVAEGAVDIAAEPELSPWDMAALDVDRQEAGGRFTDLDGRARPRGGSARRAPTACCTTRSSRRLNGS